MKFLRTAAAYVLNLLLAVIVTNIVVLEFWHLPSHADPYRMVFMELLRSAISGFGLGFSIYWTWRQPTAKWVWVAGLCWWASRAVPLWFEQHAMLFGSPHTVWSHMLGADCGFGSPQTCMDVVNYSAVFLRTIFYSIGAYCASPIRSFGFDELRRVFPGLFKLIGDEPGAKSPAD